MNLLICVWALTQDYALPLSHILPLPQFKVALRNITLLDTNHSVANIREEIRTWHCSSCILVYNSALFSTFWVWEPGEYNYYCLYCKNEGFKD